jgi:AKAP7 2'5' RNA ligase-like domain/KH domain
VNVQQITSLGRVYRVTAVIDPPDSSLRGTTSIRQFDPTLLPQSSPTTEPNQHSLTQSTGGSDDDAAAVESHNLDIRRDQQGMYVLRKVIDPVFYGSIIGKRGATLRKLQNDTKCDIQVPSRNSKSTTVTVRASSENAVVSANTRLNIAVDDAIDAMPYTHFVSFPFNTPAVQESVKHLQDTVLSSCGGDDGMDASVFNDPASLHLTCFMLKLITKDEQKRASQLLQSLAAQLYDAVGTTTLLLRVSGLAIMNDDATQAHVVYLKPADGPGMSTIKALTSTLIDAFRDEGLLSASEIRKQRLTSRDGKLSVRYHVTFMNSKHRHRSKDDEKHSGKGGHRNRRIPFNVKNTLQLFGGTGAQVEDRISGIHLSCLGRREHGSYYKALAKAPLP